MSAPYDATYFASANYAGYLERGDRYARTAAEIADLLGKLDLLHLSAHIVDYGCAVGFLIRGFRLCGYEDAVGVDVSPFAQAEAEKYGECVFATVDDIPKGRVDLLTALDVFEHVDDAEVERVFDRLKPEVAVVRIPVSTDGGKSFAMEVSRRDKTHVNCKTASQWKEMFVRRGYKALRLNLYTVYDTPGVMCALLIRT